MPSTPSRRQADIAYGKAYAYKEPANVAIAEKAGVDRNYCALMKQMVSSPVFCGIATHDERIIDELRAYVAQRGIDKRAFEFQMLLSLFSTFPAVAAGAPRAAGC